MATQVSPGVVVSEVDRSDALTQVALTEGAIAGPFTWGPVLKVQTVSSEQELVSRFGKPNNDTATTFFTGANFLSYSNTLRVVRAANSSAINATESPAPQTGTVVTNGSTTVAGTATLFTTELTVGRKIVINGETLTVNSIVNATQLTLTSAPTAANASANAVYAYGTLIKNDDHYDELVPLGTPSISDLGSWAAKYPGVLGNALRIEVCSNASAFRLASTSVNTNAEAFGVFVNTTPTTAYFNANVDSLLVGDTLIIGSEKRRVTGVSKNATATQCTVNASFTVTGNTTFTREWKYASLFAAAPNTSSFVAARGGANDEMHIVVVDRTGAISGVANTVLERYSAVSKASDARAENGEAIYYPTVINARSPWVWWIGHSTAGWGSESAGTIFAGQEAVDVADLVGGAVSETLQSGEKQAGYDKFLDELVEFSFLLGGESSVTDANYLIDSIAGQRKYIMTFLSPTSDKVVNNVGNEATDVIAFRNQLTSTSYAVLDSGWKYQYDKYNLVYRWVPLNGDVAGLASRTDQIAEPWFSPAGFTRGQLRIGNTVKLAYNPQQSDRDSLYLSGVNPVVAFPGQGTVLFGDKTLQEKPSAFDRINVRRLFIVLEKTIERTAKSLLFEQNDAFTRNQFIALVEPYLRTVQARRGISDYFVVCDESNNPQDVVDRNEFRADIYIKPIRSINFVQLNFVAVRSDVTFNEVITNS